MASASSTATTLEAAGQWLVEAEFTGAHDGTCMWNTTTSESLSGEFSFSFSLPAGATIDGIEVKVHISHQYHSDDTYDVELQDSTSTWRAKTKEPTDGAGCGDCVDDTVGGAADLWGGTWTQAHINSSSFRLRIQENIVGAHDGFWQADHCEVTVYYTAGVPPPAGVTRSLRRRKPKWSPRITKRNIRTW